MLHHRSSIVLPSLAPSPLIHRRLIRRIHSLQVWEACATLIGHLRFPLLFGLTHNLPLWALPWKLLVLRIYFQDAQRRLGRLLPVCLLVPHSDYHWQTKSVIHASIRLKEGILRHKKVPWIYPLWFRREHRLPLLISRHRACRLSETSHHSVDHCLACLRHHPQPQHSLHPSHWSRSHSGSQRLDYLSLAHGVDRITRRPQIHGGCHLTVSLPTWSLLGALNLSEFPDSKNPMQVVECTVGRRQHGLIQFDLRGITPSLPSPVPHTLVQVQVEGTRMTHH